MPTSALIRAALTESKSTLLRFLEDEENLTRVACFADRASSTLESGRRLFCCGNGGSMSEAMHFAEELAGRFRSDRAALPVLAFSDPATLTCIANDYGYEAVFSRQIEAHAGAGDMLVLLSTSGRSPNMLAAARVAREMNVETIALLGRGGGKLASEVDLPIVVNHAQTSDRIQEVHLQVLHAVIESVERRLFPENYA